MGHEAPPVGERRREEFDIAHKQFHASPAGGLRFALQAGIAQHALQPGLSLRFLMMGNLMQRPQEVGAMHVELARLVIAREAGPACAMLARHLHATLEVVYPADGEVPARVA